MPGQHAKRWGTQDLKKSSVLSALNFLSVQLTLFVCLSRNFLGIVKEEGSRERKPPIFSGLLSNLFKVRKRQVEVTEFAIKSLILKLLEYFIKSFSQFYFIFKTLKEKKADWTRSTSILSFLQPLPSLYIHFILLNHLNQLHKRIARHDTSSPRKNKGSSYTNPIHTTSRNATLM